MVKEAAPAPAREREKRKANLSGIDELMASDPQDFGGLRSMCGFFTWICGIEFSKDFI